ncbi:hypothetical protein [Paraburkholderia largidicola]|uniref:Uncharacterized protein n=1 Tax=Paraburkholderia largidicola TaxID=3014751 RepID=A0A7I8C2Y7_9BURK|nr:hypothetical protein [Paraburkholderia sp. PGU16]BCF95392.1 hypothetical protein PPGU16_84590 [Paraburkholderia sp. PGU16]
MFKASVFLAIAAALVLGLFSHATGSVTAFKGMMLAASYLALCAVGRFLMLATPDR